MSILAGCSDDDAETLSSSISVSSSVSLAATSGSTANVSFTTSENWTATCSDSWFSISRSSGVAGTSTITVTAESLNGTGGTRTSSIILSSGSATDSIIVEQVAYIETKAVYILPADGSATSIDLGTSLSAGMYSVGYTASSTWITGADLPNSSTLSLTAEENTYTNSRRATLFLMDGEENTLATFNLVQEGTTGVSTSTDFTADGNVNVLQTANIGDGINIVLMGDGFVDTEIADGSYSSAMQQAMENIFSEEPMASLRDYFNVYAVTVVSTNNIFADGYSTALGCTYNTDDTEIDGDYTTIFNYVRSISGVDYTTARAVVILNNADYAGSVQMGFSTSSNPNMIDFTIAYCPMVFGINSDYFRLTLSHEAVGHGFAFLADEYAYDENGAIPSSSVQTYQEVQSEYGWYMNVDFTSDESSILWTSFLADSRYADADDLGVYEGAATYTEGVYRSSDNSIMNSQFTSTEGFNVVSRQQIFNRVIEYAFGDTPDYEDFVDFDQQLLLKRAEQRSPRTEAGASRIPLPADGAYKPLPAPRVMNKVLESE